MRSNYIKYLFLLVLFCLFSGGVCAQKNSVKEMRRRATNLQNEIKEKESILKSSQKDVKSKMQNLELLNARINDSKKLVGVLGEELRLIDDTIAVLNSEVAENEKSVETARTKYAEALRRARFHATLQDKLLFIVSAKDFNTMVRRYRYTREYMNAHRELGRQLGEHIASLQKRKEYLDTIRAEKAVSLGLQKQQSDELQGLEKEQRNLVQELQRESKKVQRELEKQRKQLNKLNADIDRLIEQEIEAQRKREREAAERAKREAAKNKKTGKTTPAKEYSDAGISKMSGSFLQNKGKLPVPITGPYHLVSDFGKRKGVLGKGNVLIDNGGIVLQGRSGAQARCIFEGTVTSVFRTDDYALVLVRHGKYISVYCQLDKIHVKSGDKVKAGTIIGDVAKDASGQTRLLFQLRNEKQKLNPQQWIKM